MAREIYTTGMLKISGKITFQQLYVSAVSWCAFLPRKSFLEKQVVTVFCSTSSHRFLFIVGTIKACINTKNIMCSFSKIHGLQKQKIFYFILDAFATGKILLGTHMYVSVWFFFDYMHEILYRKDYTCFLCTWIAFMNLLRPQTNTYVNKCEYGICGSIYSYGELRCT